MCIYVSIHEYIICVYMCIYIYIMYQCTTCMPAGIRMEP